MTNEIGYLIQLDDETKGYQYPVSQDYLIGSSVQCNLKITENGILDQHCRIKLVNNKVCVFSLNSQNPVFLNNEPVSEEGKPLQTNDKIRINDNYQLEWKTATHRKLCSRSLPLDNESPSLEVPARYSDSALVPWKNEDRLPEECPDANSRPQNPAGQQKDELVENEAPELVEQSHISISRENDRSTVEYGNKSKRSESAPVKSRKSINPVSPFRVSNTSVSDFKNDANKNLPENDDEMILECSAKNVPEDEFEDLAMHHSSSQKPFHSTPKSVSGLKQTNIRSSSSSLIDLNLENTVEMDSSEPQKCDDLCEKPTRKSSNHDEAKKANSTTKKNVSTPSKRASESLNESRRNTRGRTSMLRKTFEENSCDEAKSLTTPEKLTESHIAQTLFAGDSEMENITDTITDYKSLNESSKAGFASASDENDTCEGSFIDKYKMFNVVKNVSVSKPAVAKCARNLSYISPPENNRSQEYMDSMVSTPQKNSPSQRESIENSNVSATSMLSNAKDTSYDDSMNTPLSSARKRRSTGFVPFVGTPSNEYRVTRKMSTPFSKSILSRTSVDFDNIGKHSSERSSTPFKLPSGKSSFRDSISCQPTIQESVSFEESEANNHEYDSINDSKFRNITKRRGRRRFGESTFAAEDKILEESELKSDGDELENNSFEDNTEASITQTSTFLEGADELSADKTKTETLSNPFALKSILTPLPKNAAFKEKSVKRVTFVIPTPEECTTDKEDPTLSADESFAMINTRKPEADTKQISNFDSLTSDEELPVSDQQETEPSCDSISEPDDYSVINSVEGKCDESSLNVTGVDYLTNIQSSLNDLSGVEQIQSPESSPATCTATEIHDAVAETSLKIDSPNEISQRSPINFTEMESSLAFSDPSNQSNVEKKSTETSNEVESSKKSARITADKNSNDSSTKISCSPGVHLSGVKSLFRTPEKSRVSAISKAVKCNLNFSFAPKNNTKAKNETKVKSASASKSIGATKQVPGAKSSRLCKSLILTKTTPLERKTEPVEKIQTEQPYETVETSEDETVAHDVCNEESTSAEQFIETGSTDEKRVANFEIPEIVVTDATFVDENANNESIELDDHYEEEVEHSKVANDDHVEVTEYQEVVVEHSAVASDESTNVSETHEENAVEHSTVSSDEPMNVTENHEEKAAEHSIVANDEPKNLTENHEENVIEHSIAANDEQMEVNKNHEEVEHSKAETSSEVSLGNNAEFETSDFEDKLNSDQDEILSSENDTTDDNVSPVITQIRRSAAKAQSDSKISSLDEKMRPGNNPSTPISSAKFEYENEIESTTPDIISLDVPCASLPSECTQEPGNESQSSSDRDDSLLSDISSTQYMGDADTMKTGICQSSCNSSQLSDATGDTSDLDSMKINMNGSSCNVSQLSDSLAKSSGDLDISKTNNAEDTLDEQLTDLLFAEEPIRPEMLHNVNVKTKIIECLSAEMISQDDICENTETPNVTKPYDVDLNVSQCTTSSQDEGIRIDASTALINDVYKELEDTPLPSNSSSNEVTPNRTFKSISFPESSYVSSIECTSSLKPETFNKPDLPFNKINDEVFTPVKTHVRGSSTPQSAVRRCRKSSRIHRCNTNDNMLKPSTPVHDCSVLLDNSLTKSNAEPAKEPREIYNEVVAELTVKLVDVKGKIDAVQKSPAKEKSPEKIIESVSCSESALSTGSISSPTSVQSSNDEDITSTISTNILTTNDEQLDNQSENETVENTYLDREQSSGVPEEVIVSSTEVPSGTVITEQSETVSSTLVTNEEENPEQSASLTVDTIPDKRSLRTRKARSAAPADGSPKRGVVTRNRQKAPSLCKKPFHCYLCLNYSETLTKCVRKTKMKQLEQGLKVSYDDKENVCSLPKVVDKPKKMDLSDKQLATTEPPVTEKRGRKPRRLKNVENITTDADSPNRGDVGKRSCSIVLPVLDPVIMKSPVKVDEEGNISLIEEPVAPKRKRVTRAVKAAEQKPAPAASRTRQKPAKTVTFDEPVEKVVRSKATATKRNLRNQTMAESETTTRSRKTANNVEIEQDSRIEVTRTIEIQLEPVNDTADMTEPVEKKTRSKRGTVAGKKAENIEETTTKVKPRRAAKRAPEVVEEDSPELPKRRRVRTKSTDDVSADEAAKSVPETLTESPKRTRGRARTNVQAASVNTVATTTKSAKTKSLETTASSSSSTSKKRTRDVGEMSAKNNPEKSTKKTKVLKNVEIVETDELVESAPVKKPAKKVTIAKEPVASTSNSIPTPRMTRSRKTEIIKHANTVEVEIPLQKTRVTKKKNAAVPKSSPTVEADSSANSKRPANVKKSPVAATKRAVVTRSKNISIKKGRVSTTLKTSSSTARKSVGKSSPVKALPKNLSTTNVRSTRTRAK